MTGGAFAVSMDHFVKANGYSNEFWGWGGEDDDFGRRLKAVGLKIVRPDAVVGKYTMLDHVKRTWTSHRQTYAPLSFASFNADIKYIFLEQILPE